jgi:hypothetical protein
MPTPSSANIALTSAPPGGAVPFLPPQSQNGSVNNPNNNIPNNNNINNNNNNNPNVLPPLV